MDATAASAGHRPSHRGRLREVAVLFLKLGAISFGGPAGHIALMEHEAVHKRQWLSRQHFLDLVAATNLVPGPNATEMAVHIGYLQAGWAGLAVAGACFILPAFAITLALAWAYVRFGSLPQAEAILYGVKPATVAIVAMAAWRLGRTSLADWGARALFAAVLAASLLGADDLLLLIGAGLLVVAWRERARLPWFGLLALAGPAPAAGRTLDGRLAQLFLYFLKVGSVLYGSGLVLYAFIQKDVVQGFGWLSQQQLVDAIAAGQVTPGPVLSSATFIGYLIGGPAGAVLATLGVFLPSFIIVALTGPWIPRLRSWAAGQAFLQGATVAALALIVRTGLLLARAAVVDPWAAALAVGCLVLLWRFKADAVWAIAAGAAAGLIRLALGA